MSRKVHYFKAGGWMYRVGYPITWMIFKLLWFYRSFNIRRLPPLGGAILASNHASHFDPVLVGLTSFRPVKFLARESLFYNPIFGSLISGLGAFPIMRAKTPEGGTVDESAVKETGGSADLRALRTAIELLTAGHRLVMFPEGTRSPDGKMRAFQPGVAMMFLRSKAPLVPIYIHGSYRVLPRKAKSPNIFRKIKVFVGEPILFEQVPTGMRSKKQHEWILTELHSRIAAMQKEAWEKYPLPLPLPAEVAEAEAAEAAATAATPAAGDPGGAALAPPEPAPFAPPTPATSPTSPPSPSSATPTETPDGARHDG